MNSLSANKIDRRDGILRDDQGVALTEFAIVIPVLLLVFFAILQYFDIARAAQLGNYAAYVAARSYAVLHDEDQARRAAALALAPSARPVLGELTIPDPSFLSLQSAPLALMLGADAVKFFMGASTAEGRLQGGNFQVSTSGSGTSEQVQVEINYPQPMNLPGLKAVWNLVAGQDMSTQLAPLASGTSISSFSGYPYLNLQSKCTTGYEDWGSKSEWKPRQGNLDPTWS